jgi:hypothetical protein
MKLSEFQCPAGRIAVQPLVAEKAKGRLDFGAAGSSTLVAYRVLVGNLGTVPPLGGTVYGAGDLVYLNPTDADSLKTATIPAPPGVVEVDSEGKEAFPATVLMVDTARVQAYVRAYTLEAKSS